MPQHQKPLIEHQFTSRKPTSRTRHRKATEHEVPTLTKITIPSSLQARLDVLAARFDPITVHDYETLPDFERILRNFDLELRYGPCIGITRTQRLIRARQLGLEVDPAIDQLLKVLLRHGTHYDQPYIEAHLNAVG